MKENTNKAIAVNSIILYVKMIVNTLCSILTTRFALQALGVVDFGLYSLLGGIITFIGIFNVIMLATSNRYIAVAIGMNDIKEANIQFNVNLIVHICIALGTLLIAFPIGNWYVNNYVNYDGDMSNALMVFNISIIASIISFIGVPYNGLLMAKENFIVFSSVDIISHVGKLIVAYILLYHFNDKLLIYTLALAVFTVLPVLVYLLYCSKHYYEIVKFVFVRERRRYKDVMSFSAWVSIGAIAMVGKNQGAGIIVNAFFNTVMNTAMGIANNICSYVAMFSQNVTQPMAPQITKSYTVKDEKRTDELLLMSTKYAFLMMFLVSSPFLIAPEWLLNVWVGQVPPYSVVFLTLLIIDNLIMSLNSGISNIIFASGKIQAYQIVTSLLSIFSVIVGFLVLYLGAPVYSLLLVYICFSIFRVIFVQIILHRTLNYSNSKIIKNSYIPCLKVVLLYLPIFLLKTKITIAPLLLIIIALFYLLVLMFLFGLNTRERNALSFWIKTKLKK